MNLQSYVFFTKQQSQSQNVLITCIFLRRTICETTAKTSEINDNIFEISEDNFEINEKSFVSDGLKIISDGSKYTFRPSEI